MRLTGKTALVTGSTSGIGLGIAKILAAEGANIIINGFGEADAIETERKGLEATSGGKAAYDGADLTKPEQIEAMFQRAEADFGGVDILVNNAGMQFVSPVEDFYLTNSIARASAVMAECSVIAEGHASQTAAE